MVIKSGRIQYFVQYGSGPYLQLVHIGSLSPNIDSIGINCVLYFEQPVVYLSHTPVAYPELVSRGVSKSRKCKWLLVKVGASKGVTPE